MEKPHNLSLDQAFLKAISDSVFANLSEEQFDVELLAKDVGMSRSQIHRKLHKIKGKSISQFVREIRLEEGLKLLLDEVGTVSEISYRVGFASPTYFNKCFRDQYGLPPGEVKKNVWKKQDNN